MNDQAELRRYLATSYPLVTIPNAVFKNRNKKLRHYDAVYPLTHHNLRGVNLYLVSQSSRSDAPGDFMDGPNTLVKANGEKLDYRILPDGYECRNGQKHVKRRRRSFVLFDAVKHVATMVDQYMKDVELKTIDKTRRLAFREMYATELQQQGASVVVVLAYYDRNTPRSPAPLPVQPAPPTPYMTMPPPERANNYTPRPYAPYPAASTRPRAQALRRLTADCGTYRRATTTRDAPNQRRATIPFIAAPTYPVVANGGEHAGTWFSEPYPPASTLPPSQPGVPYEASSNEVELQWTNGDLPVPRQVYGPTSMVTDPNLFNLPAPISSQPAPMYYASPASYAAISEPLRFDDNAIHWLTMSMSHLGPLGPNHDVYSSNYTNHAY